MPILSIDVDHAPALGDIRELGEGDWVYVYRGAVDREDWSRYWEAVGIAFSRGASVETLARF